MTNEELVEQIQDGNTELIVDLWENVKKFIRAKATDQYNRMQGKDGNEIEDFIQHGYFAFIYAIEHYDRNKEIKFITYLKTPLKNIFAYASGYKTSKRDPINNYISLDSPLDDSEEADTLLSIIIDPKNDIDDLEEKIWNEQLQTVIKKALQLLPEIQQNILKETYYQTKTIEAISEDLKTGKEIIRREKAKALKQLYMTRKRTGLEEFVEENTNYYIKGGFKKTNDDMRIVEKIVSKRENLRELYERMQIEEYNE